MAKVKLTKDINQLAKDIADLSTGNLKITSSVPKTKKVVKTSKASARIK